MRFFWFTALILVAASGSSNEIYRSVDENGNPIYSDRPHDPTAEPILIAAPRASRPAAPAAPPDAQRQESASDSVMAEVERAPTPEERAQMCAAARERLELYMTARRLFRTSEDGERDYLDSDEIDAARASAASDVETWCG